MYIFNIETFVMKIMLINLRWTQFIEFWMSILFCHSHYEDSHYGNYTILARMVNTMIQCGLN